jgi:hypothetical protein
LAAAQGGTEGKAKLAVGFLMERAMWGVFTPHYRQTHLIQIVIPVIKLQ